MIKFINSNYNFDYFENSLGKPQRYKDVFIYPIKYKNFMKFSEYIISLELEKDRTPNKKIIKTGYISWLFMIELQYYFENDINNKSFLKMFFNLMDLVFRQQNYSIKIGLKNRSFQVNSYDDIEHHLKKIRDSLLNSTMVEKDTENIYNILTHDGILHSEIIVNNVYINDNEFKDIAKIIRLQNDIEVIDETLPQELIDDLKEVDRLQASMSNGNMSTFDEQIYIYKALSKTGGAKAYEDISNMTIMQFKKEMCFLQKIHDHTVYNLMNMYGKSLKKPINVSHYMETSNSSIMKNLLTDEEFSNLSSAVGK